MAIEVVPKPRTEKKVSTNIFPYILLILFLAFVGSYFFLSFSQKKLKEEISETEKLLQKTPEEEQLEKEMEGWQKKINDFNSLISTHNFTANLFNYVEELTLPKVFYSDFKLDTRGMIVILSGQTENFEILGQQISFLKAKEFFKDVTLKDVSITEEKKIKFEIHIALDSKIFELKQ